MGCLKTKELFHYFLTEVFEKKKLRSVLYHSLFLWL